MVLSETFQFSQLKDKIIQDQENLEKKREISERSDKYMANFPSGARRGDKLEEASQYLTGKFIKFDPASQCSLSI